MWSALLYFLGVRGEGGNPWYDFHSGFASYLTATGIWSGIFIAYRKHICHVHRCWRISRHLVAGTPYVVCRKHHPAVDSAPTADDVAIAHQAANQ